jgi:uncharacterized protein DUF5110
VLALAATAPLVKSYDAPARRLYVALAGDSGAATGSQIEDDGLTMGYASGDYLDLAFAANWTSDSLEIAVTKTAGDRPPPAADEWQVDDPTRGGRPARSIILRDLSRN